MILILKDKKVSASGTEKTIEKIVKKIKDKNIEIEVASFEDLELFIEKEKVVAKFCGKDLSEYSTVFFRRVGEKRNLAFIISNLAKNLGIEFFDKLYLNTNEASKLKQTAFLAISGVSVPKTYFSGSYGEKEIKKAVDFLNFPVVVKLSKGKKGQGVFLAKNEKGLEEILNNNKEEEIFLQEFISNKFDYRILVLGSEVACVEKRSRKADGEFRNNVYLGATEEFIDKKGFDLNIQELAILAAEVANIQVAGVDIVQGKDGRAYVFEVNRAPAFTYDEDISPELNLLTEYLIKCEKEK